MTDAEVVVALGGDGFMLQTLHMMLDQKRRLPVFGMNLGTVGFLINGYMPDGLIERVALARSFTLYPLRKEARTIAGETVVSPAIN